MSLFQTLSADFQKNYMANAILGILLSSCLGSIAAMLILADGSSLLHGIHLGWIVIICMIYNAAVLVNFKQKWVFILQVMSVLSSIISIALYLIF